MLKLPVSSMKQTFELALVDALVKPGAAKDQAAKPVNQASARPAAGSPGQQSLTCSPSAEAGSEDLAIDGEVDEIFELLFAQTPADEAELDRSLLAALGEVAVR